MRVRLHLGKRPIKSKARRYPAHRRRFLDKYVETLKRMDYFVDMPTAQWQAAPLLIPKPGSKTKLRMAVDLRPVNAATIKESWPMPHLDSEMQDFAGSKCFASLDFVSAYWQLPFHKDSYTSCAVVTPTGVVASKRVLPGLANATSYFQSTVEPLFAELRANMKAWLDDFNFHAKTGNELLDLLENFFAVCKDKNLLLSARKSVLFAKELKWCGRIINSEGYTMDPANVEGLRNMEMPKTAAELAQFVYCCRWMSQTISDFNQRVAPLTDILEKAYAKSGKRTTRSIRNIPLSTLSWGDKHQHAFRDLQDSLENTVRLAYPDPEKVICMFTDASERFWSGVVTQTGRDQLALPIDQQRHESLAFLGSSFKNSELNWTTFEKEAFAIFQTFEKLDYRADTRIFTDHRNLLFIFAPLALEPSLGRHIVSKVQRWAFYVSLFDYIIEYVREEENVFAGILTRWTHDYRHSDRRHAICSLVLDRAEQIVPESGSFPWPDINVLRDSQENETEPKPTVELSCDKDDGLWKRDGRIWIPSQDVELQLKLLVTSHCGTIGHRGKDATLSVLLEDFWWPTIEGDAAEFVKKCLHCIVTRAGESIPRPIGHAWHGELPNDVLHVDFLYMGTGIGEKKYVLIIRYDLSGYVWLWPTEGATAEATAEALCQWLGVFGAMRWLVSDQGSHFKNRLIQQLTQETHVGHHFTTAYCPWANGSVERVCREVLRATRALLGEWNLQPKEWPSVLECVQAVLNDAPLKRLGLRDGKLPGVYRTPQEVFTGHKPVRQLMRALPITKYETAKKR